MSQIRGLESGISRIDNNWVEKNSKDYRKGNKKMLDFARSDFLSFPSGSRFSVEDFVESSYHWTSPECDIGFDRSKMAGFRSLLVKLVKCVRKVDNLKNS